MGTRRTFFVRNLSDTRRWAEIPFNLQVISGATAVWTSLAAADVYDESTLATVADSVLNYADSRGGPFAAELPGYDLQVAPEGALGTVRRLFGPPPNVDGDGRLDVLLFDIADDFERTGAYVAGFFDPNDLTDRAYSNRRDVLYIDLAPTILYGDQVRLSEAGSTLAHEYQHLIHAGFESGAEPETPFVNEGLSELAEILAGFAPRSAAAFSTAAPRSLFSWTHDDPLPDYARGSLWSNYLFEQVGFEQIAAFVRDPATGIASVDALLSRTGGPPLEQVLDDWAVALVGGDDSDDRHRFRHPLRRAGPVSHVASVRHLPAGISIPAPPLSVALAEVALVSRVVLDSGPAPPDGRAAIVEAWPGGPSRYVEGVNPQGGGVSLGPRRFGTAKLLLTTARTSAATDRWEIVLSGEHSARERILGYDDGFADAFSGIASYLRVGPDAAVALAFGSASEARWVRGVEFKVLFQSELIGSSVPQSADRDLLLELRRVSGGELAELLLPPRRVEAHRPLGVLKFERVDLADAFDVVGSVADSFAVVLRNDPGDENWFSVAMDQNGAAAYWQQHGNSWAPLASHPTLGGTLTGFAPMMHAVVAEPCPSTCAGDSVLPIPSFVVGSDSVVVTFDREQPVNAERSLAYVRSGAGAGTMGALIANSPGAVRYRFRIGEVGPATFVFALNDQDGVSSGVFRWTIGGELTLALGSPFPNPGGGDLHVPLRLDRDANVSAELIDVLGRSITAWPSRASPRGSSALTLAMPHLASGQYVLRVSADADSRSQSTTALLSRLR